MLSNLIFLERQERETKDMGIEVVLLALLRRHKGEREITLK